MNRIVLLSMAVLALSACQAKKPKEVAVAPAPVATTVAVVPAPAPVPVVESVVVKPVEHPVLEAAPVPVVVAIAPVAEPKPAAVVTPQPVVAPVAAPKPAPVIVKPAVPAVPAAPKVVTSAVSDADGIALAKKRNCFTCHALDKKVVGPAWKDVAAKYRGDASAQARMEAKIGKGGSGAWGSMAMPPQPQVTAEERAVLARFILNLK